MVATQMSRGALLVFEGVDRSGKSTQSKKLVSNLKDAGVRLDQELQGVQQYHVLNDMNRLAKWQMP